MKVLFLLVFLFVSLIPGVFLSIPLAKAEYRAFLLKITSKKKNQPPIENQTKETIENQMEKQTEKQTEKQIENKSDNKSENQTFDFRLVKSSLDPYQYSTYYPLTSEETITYVNSWMCRGRTQDFMPVCLSPQELERQKENLNETKVESAPIGSPATSPMN